MNEAALKDYDKRNTTAQGTNPFVAQNPAPKIQATTSPRQPRVSDEKGAVHQTAVARNPVAVDRGQTSGNSMNGTEARTIGNLRTCTKCREPISNQFVRALGGIFHLTCFKCPVWPSQSLHVKSFVGAYTSPRSAAKSLPLSSFQ